MPDGTRAAAARLPTPIGTLCVRHDAQGMLIQAWFDDDPAGITTVSADTAGGVALLDRFGRYFAGEIAALDGVPVRPPGSPFQQSVWLALRQIPVGTTCSYADIARKLGGAATGAGPNARAVGSANARNPIAIAIPCHRVIGADGRLTGYAGGLWRKQWLLAHEGWRPVQEALL